MLISICRSMLDLRYTGIYLTCAMHGKLTMRKLALFSLAALILSSTTALLTSEFPGSRLLSHNRWHITRLHDVSEKQRATTTSDDLTSCPVLVRIPKIPVLGSFFPPLTGIPPPNRLFPNRFNVEMNKAYGDFYCMTVPTFGKDIRPDLYVITDPNEMRKVVQSQPSDGDVLNHPKYKYPVGIVEQQWPFSDYLTSRNATTTANIFSRGPQWWQARQAIQHSLTIPPLEAIVDGAIASSRRLDTSFSNEEDSIQNNDWLPLPEDFLKQLNRAAFDMFEQVLFHGTLDFINDDKRVQVESNELFEATLTGMLQAQALRRSPWQNAARRIGLPTSSRKEFYDTLDTVAEILKHRVDKAARQSPVASTNDCCYVVRNCQDGKVSNEELPFACLALLMGAIDTTAGTIGWNILQLAFHPTVQHSLYEEVCGIVCGPNATIDPTSVMDRKQTPMLHGVIRETHRVTPSVTVNLIKDALCPVTIHDQEFPPQTAFMFDSTTPQLDLVERLSSSNYSGGEKDGPAAAAWQYNPRRWFPDAVQARKEAGSALLDHAYFAQPFGQGSRRCPGATVALAEVHAFVAQFVLDWEVSLGEHKTIEYRDVPSFMNTGPVPDFPVEMRIRKRRKEQHSRWIGRDESSF